MGTLYKYIAFVTINIRSMEFVLVNKTYKKFAFIHGQCQKSNVLYLLIKMSFEFNFSLHQFTDVLAGSG